MSEKRFVIDYPSLGVFDNETQKVYKVNPIFEEENLIDLLNQLNEENEALKKFIKDNFNEMMDSKMVIDDGL